MCSFCFVSIYGHTFTISTELFSYTNYHQSNTHSVRSAKTSESTNRTFRAHSAVDSNLIDEMVPSFPKLNFTFGNAIPTNNNTNIIRMNINWRTLN